MQHVKPVKGPWRLIRSLTSSFRSEQELMQHVKPVSDARTVEKVFAQLNLW